MPPPDRSSFAICRYFEYLDAGDAEGAVGEFNPDAVYIRQFVSDDGSLPRQPGFITGRSDLLTFFKSRGRQPYRHEIRRAVSKDGTEFVEGVVRAGPHGTAVVFLATATLASDGRIVRYLAVTLDVSDEDLERI